MARSSEIEKRTDDFIREFNRLKASGLITNNEEIAALLGYSSGTSISEILARRQNIPAEKWLLFKRKFGIASDNSEERFSADQLFAMFMQVSNAQTAILGDIRSKMALESTQGRMETNLNRVFGGVETIGERQDHAIKKILADLSEIKGKISGPS